MPQLTPEQLRDRFEEKFKVGSLTASQRNKLNKFKPELEDDLEQEFIHVPVLATTNLLHLSNMAWKEQELKIISRTYPGQPFTLNHSSNAKDIFSIVYDSELLHYENPSDKLVNTLLKGVGNHERKYSKEIVQEDGLFILMAFGAVTSPSVEAEKIQDRTFNKVSTHVASSINKQFEAYCGKHQCPVSECGCILNTPFIMTYWYRYMDDEEKDKLTPYYYFRNATTASELSVVWNGDNPAAEILSSEKAELLLNG